MQQSAMLKIEVAYALPDKQFLIPLEVPTGTTALEAIERSGIFELCPELDLQHLKIGIYSKVIQPETVLQNHDRVELYRPLKIDPKQKRIIRAKSKKNP